MPRVAHGASVTPEELHLAHEAMARTAAEVAAGFAVAAPSPLQNFDFLFPELQNDPAKLLKTGRLTVRRLRELGRRMADPGPEPDPGDSEVPSIYTYFGQFVDHDITFEQTSLTLEKLLAGDLAPLSLATIRDDLKNTRNASLELDSVYGSAAVRDPGNNDLMKIGKVSKTGETAIPFRRPPGKGDDNDLPRTGRNPKAEFDRAAQIGDPRNDENLIVSQLHLAFLKAHNRLVNQGRDFADARRVVRQHYQHIVIHDFLKRVADPAVVDSILTGGNRFYHAEDEPFFLPLEFTVTAFRFGHTMVRDIYDYNLNFPQADLLQLFTFTAFSGQLGEFDTVPENWIIQWERFIGAGGGLNKARRFDTKLSGGLFQLQTIDGVTDDEQGTNSDRANLAIRNLLRGYALRMPTGQALAGRMNLPVLTANQIKAAAASPEQAEVLAGDSKFLERTPLWYYLLAEAKHHGGDRLGPVGSNLVAEVLIGLVRRSEDSILRSPGWRWTLPSSQPDRFVLADLLRFARVAGGGASTKIYKVKANDTLKSIAEKQLGDAKRWPEIFVLNRDKIRHRDQLTVGSVFSLPGDTPILPRPTLHRTKSGDTLSKMADRLLGDASRWPEIQRLNRDIVPNPNTLGVGLDLVVVRD